jgi:DNA-binding transcriptional ArsR family regulator
MQIQEITLTNPEAARALRDNELLGEFLEPRSPSDVAKKLGQAANVVHHHAKRFLELGLLFEVKREARRVFYQLTARRFRYDRKLLGEVPEHAEMQELSTAFTNAYQHSSSLEGHEPDYSIHWFGDRSEFPNQYQAVLIRFPEDAVRHENLEAHPTHYSARTFQLSSKKYLELVKTINQLMMDCHDEPSSSDGLCTFALLAFDGATREGGTGSAALNSFIRF